MVTTGKVLVLMAFEAGKKTKREQFTKEEIEDIVKAVEHYNYTTKKVEDLLKKLERIQIVKPKKTSRS